MRARVCARVGEENVCNLLIHNYFGRYELEIRRRYYCTAFSMRFSFLDIVGIGGQMEVGADIVPGGRGLS